MKILVVNPNTTASMTAKIDTCARAVAQATTQIVTRNPAKGPDSIEGYFDEVISGPELLKEIHTGEAEGMDGYVVACFDDPFLGACREIATGPVIGIGEAAMQACSIIASSFTILTTLPRSIPIIEDNVIKYGMERRCRRVRAVDIPVLSLEEDPVAKDKILAAINTSLKEDMSEAIVLGCAGMADLALWLGQKAKVPVIDGVAVAVKFVEGLVSANLVTSKVRAYSRPRNKVVV